MRVKAADFVLFLVDDLQRSIDFYRDFLGMPLEFYKEEWKWAELNAGNVTLTLCGEGNPHSLKGLRKCGVILG